MHLPNLSYLQAQSCSRLSRIFFSSPECKIPRTNESAGKPFVGNLLDIPPARSWLILKERAYNYGPLFVFSLMGRNMIVVSTNQDKSNIEAAMTFIYYMHNFWKSAEVIYSLVATYQGKVNNLARSPFARKEFVR